MSLHSRLPGQFVTAPRAMHRASPSPTVWHWSLMHRASPWAPPDFRVAMHRASPSSHPFAQLPPSQRMATRSPSPAVKETL